VSKTNSQTEAGETPALPGSVLLTLIHLSDSALPIGGFSHSWGLETWCQSGLLANSDSVFACVRELLRMSVAPQDGRACALAHQFAQQNDLSNFSTLNAHLTASRWTDEPREASLKLGARFLKLSAASSIVSNLNGLDLARIHHCAAFGWVCAIAGVSAADAVAAYLYTSCMAMVSASVRLIPLGQTEGQVVLARLRVEVENVVDQCLFGRNGALELDDISSFAPMHEQACVEHQSLYSRLFQS